MKEHFEDKVRIVSAGADWNPSAYNADGVIEHLGMLPYKKTADLYRKCHVGVAMMMTRHPSYLPFELMACGSLVVANDNRWNKWLLKNDENCILSKPTVSCLSNDIIDALNDKARREKLAKSGSANILNNHSDWDKEFKGLLAKLSEIH
ncbi:Glycosyl transferases group 1 [compost metagenome]